MKTRYEITGTWSGPRSPAGSWTGFVHRETVTDSGLAEFCQQIGSILYSDGTCLYLSVRKLKKGERKQKDKPGYSSLIRDCYIAGMSSVDALYKRKTV